MKTLTYFCSIALSAAFVVLVIAQTVVGQQSLKVPPRVILENANVTVIEFNLQPGEKVEGTTDRAAVVCILTDCRIRTSTAGKEPSIVDYIVGQVLWSEPARHVEENIGTTTARALVTVLKTPLQKSGPLAGTLSAMQMNRDDMINSLNNIAAHAYQFRIRPKSMAGGGSAYTAYEIPPELASTKNASYESRVANADLVQFVATSKLGYGTINVTLDERGRLANWEYSGSFMEERGTPTVSVESNRDAIIKDLNNLAAFSYQYRIRPKSMGGGEGLYDGFAIPPKMRTNESASYISSVLDGSHVQFKAVSSHGFGTVQVQIDQDGRMSQWTYTGKFQ
jgi:beta-alanine degradation protein BauB